MNNYMIYTHISSIMCGFACFERFFQNSTLQVSSMLLEDFFMLMDQQSLQGKPKSAQHGQNMPNTAGENSATRSQKKANKKKIIKKEKVVGQPPPWLARGGWHGHAVWHG